MKNQEITLEEGTDSVTLHIPKSNTQNLNCTTLTQALMSTKSNTKVILRIKEDIGLQWELDLGPYEYQESEVSSRSKRIEQFKQSQLCNASKILNSPVISIETKSVLIKYSSGTTQIQAIVYEVELKYLRQNLKKIKD